MLDQILSMTLAFFLCEYSPASPKRKTEAVAREFVLRHFSEEITEEFLSNSLDKLQRALVDEFNSRFTENRYTRFEIADKKGEGVIVRGCRHVQSPQQIRFQDALNTITPRQFEKLAAIILKHLGCKQVFFTPESHDQGVDAFGYQKILAPMPYGVMHDLVWIAQAKHYKASRVSTSDVRELVGSKELLVARIFSTVDERYKELQIKPYAPSALALITSEEIPSTVRRLAERSGLYVFASSDLFHIFKTRFKATTATKISRFITSYDAKISKLQ